MFAPGGSAEDPNVQVSYGHPGMSQINDIIAFTRTHVEQEFATYGPRRQREETLELTVVVSVFRPGGPDQEEVASDRAYELLGVLEEYARATDTTIGGSVRDCALGPHDSDGESDPEVLAQGRLIEVKATFIAHARITST